MSHAVVCRVRALPEVRAAALRCIAGYYMNACWTSTLLHVWMDYGTDSRERFGGGEYGGC